MTCTHVLGLIDAGPFADYPRAHRDAAWRHARACATCGPALKAATALTAELVALPQPVPPPHLAAAILSRIARIEQVHSPAAAAERRAATDRSRTRDWPAWVTSLAGLSAGLAIVLSMSLGVGPFGVGGITEGLVPMPATATGAIVLAAGLMLYAAGLFTLDRARPMSDRS